MTKKVTFEFNNQPPVEQGMKFVLLEIVIPGDITTVKHDWGFMYWKGDQWDSIDIPEGWTATVAWWADTLHPDVLLVEPSKIIKLN